MLDVWLILVNYFLIYNTMDKKEFLENVESFLPESFSAEVRKVIACQFALESNFGRSPLAENFNNFCGMHHPIRRPSLSLGAVSCNYASYDSLESCILDYLLWLSWNHISDRKFKRSKEVFLQSVVDANYCPTPGYLNSIINLFNDYYND